VADLAARSVRGIEATCHGSEYRADRLTAKLPETHLLHDWASHLKSVWREETFEVNGVLECSRGVVCSAIGRATAEREEIPAITWQDFLLAGRPGTEWQVVS
jgi:hypothetical protein